MTERNGARSNILAIESAVAGGSVALIREGSPVVLRSEGNDSSRAEKLISVIAEGLDEVGLGTRDLDLIAVSTGPGSYSGIRIGISTAIGLANALSIRCEGVSVLEAMAFASGISGPMVAAVPVGKNDVAWQEFARAGSELPTATSHPDLLPISSFADQIESRVPPVIFAHHDLIDRIAGSIPETIEVLNAGMGLASFVGRLAARCDSPHRKLQPLYLRNRQGNRPAIF